MKCEFCSREYSRNDALRRHYQSCPGIGSQKPLPHKPGRRRKACDNCAKNRIICNGRLPCRSCSSQGTQCSYRRLDNHRDAQANASPGSSRTQPPQTSQDEPEDDSGKLSVPFLLNYSATSNHHPGEVNNVLSALAIADSKDKKRDAGVPSSFLEPERNELFFEESWSLFFGSYQDQDLPETSYLPRGLDDINERQRAASRIIEALHGDCIETPKKPEDIRADRFFTEDTIQEFIVAYFDRTVRPRSRIVLKSCFHLPSTSTPLLLSILLMGAICGGSNEAKSNATDYADKAESILFDDPSFQRLVYRKAQPQYDPLQDIEIEFIQAAILIILIQISSPNPESRRRVRIHRYPLLVSVARATGLVQINNTWHDPSMISTYESFLKNELSIRMMASIAMIDTHFIIFFNALPILSPSELGFDLPAEEAGVDITDRSAWEDWAASERKYQRPPPLNKFIRDLLSDSWTGINDPRYQNLNIFALFIIISKFHPIIFNLRSSLLKTDDQVSQIERALSRWMALWEKLQHRLTEEEIFRAGFMIHAPDLVAFARLLLRTPLDETNDIAKDSMAHIHELLKGPSS